MRRTGNRETLRGQVRICPYRAASLRGNPLHRFTDFLELPGKVAQSPPGPAPQQPSVNSPVHSFIQKYFLSTHCALGSALGAGDKTCILVHSRIVSFSQCLLRAHSGQVTVFGPWDNQ